MDEFTDTPKGLKRVKLLNEFGDLPGMRQTKILASLELKGNLNYRITENFENPVIEDNSEELIISEFEANRWKGVLDEYDRIQESIRQKIHLKHIRQYLEKFPNTNTILSLNLVKRIPLPSIPVEAIMQPQNIKISFEDDGYVEIPYLTMDNDLLKDLVLYLLVKLANTI